MKIVNLTVTRERQARATFTSNLWIWLEINNLVFSCSTPSWMWAWNARNTKPPIIMEAIVSDVINDVPLCCFFLFKLCAIIKVYLRLRLITAGSATSMVQMQGAFNVSKTDDIISYLRSTYIRYGRSTKISIPYYVQYCTVPVRYVQKLCYNAE